MDYGEDDIFYIPTPWQEESSSSSSSSSLFRFDLPRMILGMYIFGVSLYKVYNLED